MRFHRLPTLHQARYVAAVCAGSLLAAGSPAWAQLGGITGPGLVGPSIGPGVGPTIIQAPPIQTAPSRIVNPCVRSNVDQTVRGVRQGVHHAAAGESVNGTIADTATAAAHAGETTGTFVADVSGHVKADFTNLTGDLRSAIDGAQGNVREKLIAINERLTAISSNLVDRAKETNEQARDRLGEVRNELNEIHNDLTTLAGNTTDETRTRIIAVRDRVDTLRDHLQAATESRLRGTLESLQSRVTTVEQRARDTAENVRARTRSTVEDLRNRVANVQQRAQGLIGNVENRASDLAQATVARAATVSAEMQRRAHDDLQQVQTGLTNVLTTVDDDVRGRLESVDERLTSVREDLGERAGETADQARNRIAAVRERLSEVHTDLSDILRSTTGDAKDEMAKLRDRIGEVRDRLDVAGVASIVREEVGALRDGILSSGRPGIEINSDQQGKLGVTVRQGSTALTVTSVFAGSVAAEMGLQPGDQILAINRHRIISRDQLVTDLKTAAQGDGDTLVMIRRHGRTQELRANLVRAAHEGLPANPTR